MRTLIIWGAYSRLDERFNGSNMIEIQDIYAPVSENNRPLILLRDFRFFLVVIKQCFLAKI